MKKDKISFFVLLIEIVSIVALHAYRNDAENLAGKAAETQSSSAPIFTVTAAQANSTTYLILPSYPF